jgi:dihydropteroate synthase
MAIYASLAGLEVGDGFPVRLVGALNVSPESFYQGSVFTTADSLRQRAEQMVAEGAALLDIGAMSTAPYLVTAISEEDEIQRLSWAVGLVRRAVSVPLSVDTARSRAAAAALEAGAQIVNDVSGLRRDPAMASVVASHASGVILMASETVPGSSDPSRTISGLLAESLHLARGAGIPPDRVVLDPGIGFFRQAAMGWDRWDCAVLRRLRELRALGQPLLLGLSRKSFIGKTLGRSDPKERLPGSLAATALAVVNGAHLIRTHDVGPTLDAVRMAEAIRTE